MRISQLGRLPLLGLFMGLCAVASVAPASADIPGAHPAYLHGLRDLRVAHAYLDHQGDRNLDNDEVRALRSIDAAYGFALRAAEDDRKDIHATEPIDANLRHRGRIMKSISALEAAKHDFGEYESDGPARGWQHEAITWVDRAIIHARAALRDQKQWSKAHSWDHGY